MKNMLMIGVFGLVLFGISAGASWYLNVGSVVVAKSDMSQDGETTEDPLKPDLQPNTDEIEKVDGMPVVHHEQSPITIEQVLKMSDSIRKMEGKIKEREKLVEKEEHRIELLFEDLTREKNELVAFSEGIGQKLEALDQMTVTLKETLDQLDARKLELEKLEKNMGVDEESQNEAMELKVNQIKDWFSGLEPEQAADFIKEFANNGDLSFASALIHKMDSRQKHKVLGAIGDPGLVQDLINALLIEKKSKK